MEHDLNEGPPDILPACMRHRWFPGCKVVITPINERHRPEDGEYHVNIDGENCHTRVYANGSTLYYDYGDRNILRWARDNGAYVVPNIILNPLEVY